MIGLLRCGHNQPNAARSEATIRRSLRSAPVPETKTGGECTQNHTRIGNLCRRCAVKDTEESKEIGGMVKDADGQNVEMLRGTLHAGVS